jgi:hypothetical protein
MELRDIVLTIPFLMILGPCAFGVALLAWYLWFGVGFWAFVLYYGGIVVSIAILDDIKVRKTRKYYHT